MRSSHVACSRRWARPTRSRSGPRRSPAHPPLRAATRARDSRVEDPRDRSDVSGGLRIEAERLRRGGTCRRARNGSVDPSSGRRNAPRTSPRSTGAASCTSSRSRRPRTASSQPSSRRRSVRWGVPPARHARDSAAGCVALLGPYAIPNYSVTFTGVFTNTTPTDAYRGAGRPRGDLRARAHDGRACRQARHRSRRAEA